MSGKLYICPTPIGNLEDITYRTLKVLNEVDLIAAEDTRHSIKLLNHFEISKPLTSYFEHNKDTKGDYLINKLLDGENIALISDAGMPGISDPGEDLIKQAIENNIEIIRRCKTCKMEIPLKGCERENRKNNNKHHYADGVNKCAYNKYFYL